MCSNGTRLTRDPILLGQSRGPSWIAKCCSKLIYETLSGKEIVYVLPITSILGRLPVVRGDTGTILLSYRDGCCLAPIATTTTLLKLTPDPGLGTVFHVLCQFLRAGLVSRSMRLKKSENVITHYHVLLHIYG